ncbi:unnamed protein product, partial [Ixodes hexagonus]
VLIGQIINFPVTQGVPQPSIGSTADVSNTVSPLAHEQKQVVGNLTFGFSAIFSSVVNPVLLHNASASYPRVRGPDAGPTAAHGHDHHNNHGSEGVHTHHDSHGCINVHHGIGQTYTVSGIPVLIIKKPAASISATFPIFFILSPVVSDGGQLFLARA